MVTMDVQDVSHWQTPNRPHKGRAKRSPARSATLMRLLAVIGD